jgi:F-type H+-transporting ATPase subunit epsilon
VFSGEVTQVDVPGVEREFGVLAEHAPFIATVKPGILTVHGEGQPQRIAVDGGFAEVGPAGLTVLTDMALPVDQVDRARLAASIKDTEEDLADSKDDRLRDKLAHRIDQLKTLQAALGH